MSKQFELIRWQHEDTGYICELPKGKIPGCRWFKIPAEKKLKAKWKAQEKAILPKYETREMGERKCHI